MINDKDIEENFYKEREALKSTLLPYRRMSLGNHTPHYLAPNSPVLSTHSRHGLLRPTDNSHDNQSKLHSGHNPNLSITINDSPRFSCQPSQQAHGYSFEMGNKANQSMTSAQLTLNNCELPLQPRTPLNNNNTLPVPANIKQKSSFDNFFSSQYNKRAVSTYDSLIKVDNNYKSRGKLHKNQGVELKQNNNTSYQSVGELNKSSKSLLYKQSSPLRNAHNISVMQNKENVSLNADLISKYNMGRNSKSEWYTNNSKKDIIPIIPIIQPADDNQQLQLIASLEAQVKQLRSKEEVYKSEIQNLTDQVARLRACANSTESIIGKFQSDSQNHLQQVRALSDRVDNLHKLNSDLSHSNADLKGSNQSLKQRLEVFTALEQQLRRQFCRAQKGATTNPRQRMNQRRSLDTCSFKELVEVVTKDWRRMNGFVSSVVDMRNKFIRKSTENNNKPKRQEGAVQSSAELKEVWRWLKEVITNVAVIQDSLNDLKKELGLPPQAKFEELVARVRTRFSKK